MHNFENRKYIVLLIFLSVGVILISRLFYIQVIDDKWKIEAATITQSQKTIYPSRGLIKDRNGHNLVENQTVYDLWVTPNKVKDLDSLAFCKMTGLSIVQLRKKFKKAYAYASYAPSVMIKQIPSRDFAKINERLYKFKGFEKRARTLRYYPEKSASHLLGYIREIGQEDLKKNHYYKMGDYWGLSGLEKQYEKDLRGGRGTHYFLRDALNKEKKDFLDGRYDTLAMPGKDLITTLDMDLQIYAEKLLQNKRGTVVAIDPNNGEILSMVSAPYYDPNRFVGREFSKNYTELYRNDSLNPLLNRAITANYRPGSIFKLVQALVALQEGVIRESSGFPCNKALLGCHNHPDPFNVERAIQHSCNPYFYRVYKRLIQRGKDPSKFVDSRLGIENWKKKVETFGLGHRLETDIPGVMPGRIPGGDFYDRWYGKNRWAFSTIYSNAIGEGELAVTPLQMANLACILANRGSYFSPHLVRAIGENGEKRPEFLKRHYTSVDSLYFRPVVNAMEKVVESGTARRAYIKDFPICGKTGTVQNGNFEDHSVFIAFAPKDDPKIAIAVYVEYAGFGGTWAAPIASLMIEKYLRGEISNPYKEQRILDAVLLDKYEK